MKQENFDYLKNQLYYKGFKDSLENELKVSMEKGEKQFVLPHAQTFGKDLVNSTLLFNRSDKGYYFFDKFDVALKKENGEELKTGFYMDKNSDYTLKEAYNLLNGRFVEKEKQTKDKEVYQAWDQLDLTSKDKNGNYPVKSYGERYGFELEKELNKLPIKTLQNPDDKELLIASLRRGNRQLVAFELGNEQVDRYIEANVKMRRIDVYDTNGKKVENKIDKSARQELSKSTEKDKKQDTSDEDGPAGLKTAQKKSRKKGRSV
ncbi:MAG: hypothetical protein J0I32_20205 [Sphingobacteriales bacterium]|nr:hypothetical protein [Sphingobacteriales bacterium]OJV98831.1 MAG: hypothetical protein BGO52_08670 [Sphingobacteriales bacterium 44-61]